ncbi:uncharacterized protein mkg-p [Drosophila virilis]|uniref:Uncharacterized protein, isoform A n=1 Tax=Drosophila virilis TaxID=7244 RepID=B4LDR9_DROVI|nr:uncharacterized protein LOC6624556 [Drosophila virilis]XP_015030897.1 uncharacterized protein LOC6624556 [Drosophila virilis]EDW68942.1 uncharacterized protein Dvir_GJ12395, isoform A [Drosophila virilis]KRF84092.1 uncharacterized protein Dvir_GJ12395, isoform B [Drosophila virilis]KRF84093.1 uncharacterized protein Dvir_GJ12395, isoform C [Drosophila virilis]
MSDLETRTRPSQDESVHCKVCDAPFKTLQDCLAHELLKHTIKPQKKLRKCLDAITKLFASEQIQCERRVLKATLAQAPAGQHLRAVLAFYSGNCNELSACFAQVRETLQKQLQGRVKVYPFGSLVTGLALKDSDIDLFLEQTDTSSNSMSHRQLFNKIYNFLRRTDCFQDVFAIRHARVPIIRCKHVYSGLSLDINMSSPNSTYNSRFVAELLGRDVRMRELFLFLKLWAKKLKIIGSGSMTSYCLITLIIFGMQQRRQLPSIKQLQARCPVLEVMGVNYAYSFQQVRPIPASLTTLDLISSFFELYSQMEFEKKLLSPYLGCALDLETAFSTPGKFPEYEEQLKAMHKATGEQPEPFQYQRCVCVQDPFELQHNVGQSISITNLCYLRECLALATKACSDKRLVSTPAKLYDYLLFGLAEKLLQGQRLDQEQPAKVRKQMLNKPEQTPMQRAQPDGSEATTQIVADDAMDRTQVAATAKPAVAATSTKTVAAPANAAVAPTANCAVVAAAEFAAEVAAKPKERLSSSSSVENAPPLMHVHTLKPTNNDLKSLPADFLSKNRNVKQTIYYYWAECYVDAIKDILTNIYGLNLKLIEPEEPLTTNSNSNALPQHFTWLINTTLDTWSARNFQRSTRQSFFAQQLQQTIEFIKTRPNNANYAVNLCGRFSLIVGPDYKELRLELQPMPSDALGLQRHSPLTKFFKSLKNMLCNYKFKEKVISLQQYQH